MSRSATRLAARSRTSTSTLPSKAAAEASMVGCGACVKARSRFYAGIIGTAVHRLPTEGDMAPTVVASPLKRILWANVERVPPSANEGQGWVVSRCAPASTHCWPTTRADKIKGQPGLRSVLCGRLCVVVGCGMFCRTPPAELYKETDSMPQASSWQACYMSQSFATVKDPAAQRRQPTRDAVSRS